MAPARFGRKRPAVAHFGSGVTQFPKVANRPALPVQAARGGARVLQFPKAKPVVFETPARPTAWELLHAALDHLETAFAQKRARKLETALRRAREAKNSTRHGFGAGPPLWF